MKIFNSTPQLIGNTPIIELANIQKAYGLKARLLAKLERTNPTGSIKDRVAKAMIDDAEARGILSKDSVIIEPTSGNTGIGLACVGTSRGYKVIIVMPDNMSEERKTLMKAYGAELVLTDGKKGMAGAIEKAKELCSQTPNAYMPNQFENPANVNAHFTSTAPEIYTATNGQIDIFVAGIGTSGTFTGISKFLKEQNPLIKTVGFEPASSPILTEGKSGAHAIQGIGAGFVPPLFESKLCDEILTVTNENALCRVKELGKIEGLFVGISSGAALDACITLARREENFGKTIVTVFPDTGDRYLSAINFD